MGWLLSIAKTGVRLPGARPHNRACWKAIRLSMTRGLDQSSIGAHAIHRVGEVLRQHRKNLVGRQANGVGELLDKRIAERLTVLLGADRRVGSIAEPGSDLAAET